MTYEELCAKDKKAKQAKVIYVLTIPVMLVLCALAIVILYKFGKAQGSILFVSFFGMPIILIIAFLISKRIYKSRLVAFETAALMMVGEQGWAFTSNQDDFLTVKSRQATNIDSIKYFKSDISRLPHAIELMNRKRVYKEALLSLLNGEEYKKLSMHKNLSKKIRNNLQYVNHFYVVSHYSSPTGRSQATTILPIPEDHIYSLASDKSLLMSKTEYNKYLKEQAKGQLEQKQHLYYEKVNHIIDTANNNAELLVNSRDNEEIDKLIASLFDRTVNSIKKIKSLDSEEWEIIGKYISQIEKEVNSIVNKNNKILSYYNSSDFRKIKDTCDTLMHTQKEFNEYIEQKVKSISDLFGKSVKRNETDFEDEYNYIHPYKKNLTPFTAEVSDAVFSSAENNPIDYIVKCFYPNKDQYPDQIQKLQLLVEELETLKEAKGIIDNYKNSIQQYLDGVPSFIIENDEDGFYSRLGFATINEKTLTVEYKFSYTSKAGKAQRSFTVPMTEETIIELINRLENKLTLSAFTKEQRALMTSKLRMHIKERDNYTCKICGNSIYQEPNLLLEVDHIIPIAKGGYTAENNLQTLCWKCNRNKGTSLMNVYLESN
ncbi:MAG: HNH endonuclease [Saccharofermentans sp.]|nr:HNH endonuclease [Saccharofermentans sp.]